MLLKKYLLILDVCILYEKTVEIVGVSLAYAHISSKLYYFFVKQVSLEYDEDRALHTLPPGLVVKTSSIIGAGLGVFTEREIPPRVMFGPYGGVEIHDEMTAHDSGYCWQVKLLYSLEFMIRFYVFFSKGCGV
jgi:hypothetical protein